MNIYEIRDPIYGFITFNEWEKEIIDHPIFQRLRNIRQLGLTSMVYPGAMHTRFEHSLGTMHLATKMYDAIIEKEDNREILKNKYNYNDTGLKRDRQLIRLAALLHDVGHPPFSHSADSDDSDGIMPLKNNKTGEPFTHEDYSAAIIKGPLKDVIEKHKINETNYKIEAEEVAALIKGDPTKLGERIFWKILISSQLDADRGDYLMRDSHHIGVKYGIYDLPRLLNTLTLGEDQETKDIHLGIDEDGWHVAESIVIARYQMFTQVYFHRTRRAYDYHLKEAIKSIIEDGKLPPPTEIERFLELDDSIILNRIKENHEEYHCRAILKRNHIRKVYETPETPTKEDEEKGERIKEKLANKKIKFYEDRAKKSWYKLEKSDKEIMIIKKEKGEKKVRPLSHLSHIVNNMREIRQIRIYVNPEDREKAEEVLKNEG